jgi:hypothetical protein
VRSRRLALLVAEMGDLRPMTDPVDPRDHSGFPVKVVAVSFAR